jgi:large repetitive protein
MRSLRLDEGASPRKSTGPRRPGVRALSLSAVVVLLCGAAVDASAQTSFGSVAVGSSASATVTVTIPAAATLTGISVVTQGAPNLDFTNAGGATCATATPYSPNAA